MNVEELEEMRNQYNDSEVEAGQDTVRVLRIIEYVGPREFVEETLRRSIHGEKKHGQLIIRVTTLGLFPEIMARETKERKQDATNKPPIPNEPITGSAVTDKEVYEYNPDLRI